MGTTNQPDYLEKTRNSLGLLLVGFVGVLNVIGLSGDQVGDVLRNNATLATLVVILLFGALASAMGSVFVSSDRKVNRRFAWGLITLAFTVASLSVAAVRIPGRESDTTWSVIISVALAIVTVFLMVRSRKTTEKDPWQLVLLAYALILTSTSAYAAVRLRTKSELEATLPQVAASIKSDGVTGEVSASVSASRLGKDNNIGVLIRGIPRAVVFSAKCGHRTAGECLKKLCKAYPNKSCKLILSGAFMPDSAGAIKDKAFSTIFPLSAYQMMEVRATVCDQSAPPKPTSKPKRTTAPSPTHRSASPSSSSSPKPPRHCTYNYNKAAVAYLTVPNEVKGASHLRSTKADP